MPEKGLRLLADTSLGEKYINFSPFINKHFAAYRSVVIRASGNDQNITRIKDMTISSVERDLGLDYMDYRPAILLINGEYWGIYNLREKVNAEYLFYNRGAPKNSLTTLIGYDGENNREYHQLLKYTALNFPQQSAIDSVNTMMDLENYLNYIILQLHIKNNDSKGNIRFWKSKALDDRWRWIFYDADLSCEPANANVNFIKERISPVRTEWHNPPWVTVLLRNLLSQPEIKNLFINQYCFLMGTVLNKDSLQNRVEKFASIIRPEIPFHIKRRGGISRANQKNWETHISRFKYFFELREPAVYEHIQATFGLEKKPVKITVTNNLREAENLRLKNTGRLFGNMEGLFFPDVPVHLEATNLNYNYKFERWAHAADSLPATTIYPLNNLIIEAVYKEQGFSSLFNYVFCDAWITRLSRKESFFAFRIFNNSYDTVRTSLFTLVKNGFEYQQPLPDFILPPGEACWFTNEPARASKFIRHEPIEIMNEIPGFSLSGGSWIILDNNNLITDQININFPDSLITTRELLTSFRENPSENWYHQDKVRQFDPHVPRSILPAVAIRKYAGWHVPASVLMFVSGLILLRRGKRNY
jgi:hypothetical protein